MTPFTFDTETLQFLDRPLLMRLATHGADGYPQVTPVWFVSPYITHFPR